MKIKWVVDFPIPNKPNDMWKYIASFDKRQDAVKCVMDYGLPRDATKYFISRFEVFE